MTVDAACEHFPIGYLIVQKEEHTGIDESFSGKSRRYKGVDRLPPFIPPDPTVRQELGLPCVENDELFSALDDWFNNLENSNPFIAQRQRAFQLISKLRRLGPSLEMLFCDLAWTLEDEHRLAFYQEAERENDNEAIVYGYDVSWPSCNHSAIIQPGVIPGNGKWESLLNQWGLLDSFFDAQLLRSEYLKIYPYPPFDIFRVMGVLEGK